MSDLLTLLFPLAEVSGSMALYDLHVVAHGFIKVDDPAAAAVSRLVWK